MKGLRRDLVPFIIGTRSSPINYQTIAPLSVFPSGTRDCCRRNSHYTLLSFS